MEKVTTNQMGNAIKKWAQREREIYWTAFITIFLIGIHTCPSFTILAYIAYGLVKSIPLMKRRNQEIKSFWNLKLKVISTVWNELEKRVVENKPLW